MLVHHVDNMMLNQTWCLVWDSPEEDPEARFQVLLVYFGSVPRKTVEESGNETEEGKQTISKFLLWIITA